MPKIICELENASTEISGIKFIADKDGRLISETDVEEPHLSIFLSIPGYYADGVQPSASVDENESEKTDAAPDKESDAKPDAKVKETAAQRKARLKSEQEAAAAAAAEEAVAKETEGESDSSSEAPAEPAAESDEDEVF